MSNRQGEEDEWGPIVSEESELQLSRLFNGTKSRIKERTEFYARSGKKNFTTLSQRSGGILLKWLELKAAYLETRVEKVLWAASRPIGWLNRLADRVDQKIRETQEAHVQNDEEKKLHDIEISRMMGEGGAVVEPPPEESKANEKTA